MMKNNQIKKRQQGGFLELIVIILVALILLRFLDINVDSVFTKAWVQEFITYTKEMLILVWRDIVTIFYAIKGV